MTDDTPATNAGDGTTPLERETAGDTTTVEHFGRSWTIPTQRHLRHLIRGRNEIRYGVTNYGLLMTETFLSAEEFAELVELDPTEDALEELGEKIAKALGLETVGNS